MGKFNDNHPFNSDTELPKNEMGVERVDVIPPFYVQTPLPNVLTKILNLLHLWRLYYLSKNFEKRQWFWRYKRVWFLMKCFRFYLSTDIYRFFSMWVIHLNLIRLLSEKCKTKIYWKPHFAKLSFGYWIPYFQTYINYVPHFHPFRGNRI